tara:strand:+ start:3945 stop:5705 length:1761 start_codon:yes stop_codon:yes gene_type:complete
MALEEPIDETDSTLKEISTIFKVPIFYNKDKRELNPTIINDLEMSESYDPSYNPIKSFVFNSNSENKFSQRIGDDLIKYYTTDITYLKDTQQVLNTYLPIHERDTHTSHSNMMRNVWHELKSDTGFKEKYHYVDWTQIEFLNNSEIFLQTMSIYNLLSPLVSFLTPIIIVILPFLMMKLQGIKVDLTQYTQIFKSLLKNNALGRLFVDFNNVSPKDKMVILISAAFYVLSIYQNVLVCIRFNSNMIKIHKYITDIAKYLEYSLKNMTNYLKFSGELATQQTFNECLQTHIKVLDEIKLKLNTISEYKLTFSKVGEIGKVMKYFYELHNNTTYNDSIVYSFGFNGYIDCLEGMIENITDKKLQFCTFQKKTYKKNKKTILTKSYYAPLKDTTHVKNTIKLTKNLIITGPNASGKTTILKTILINIICSQQFGCGFYKTADITPFDFIHCYLNIPDTSGRDSLFQAEARRCKEIIDIVNENKKSTHLCVFDELYSGTNPDEAVSSSTSLMKYLIKYKSLTCLLTTHFTAVCTNLDNEPNLENVHMDATKSGVNIEYTYKVKKGISIVKGGANVLHNLDYPKEILSEFL